MTALERAIADPPRVAGFGRRSPVHGLDRRSIGFGDVFGQSVSAIAPSAAATTMPLLVARSAGPATVLALATAAVLVLLVAVSVNQFARRIAATGSLYTYVSRGLGARTGIVAGLALALGYGFVSMFSIAGCAYYALFLVSRFAPRLAASPVAAVVVIAVAAVAVFAVIAVGVRLSTRLTLVVESASVALVLVLIVALLVQAGPPSTAGLTLASVAPLDFVVGSVLAVTAFVGFESASVLGAEARRPLRSIPRAITWSAVGAGVLYLVAGYGQLLGFAALGRDLADSPAPVNDLATAYGVEWMGWLLDVSVATSFLACAIASTTALVRVLFAMGREGVLPAALGRTHPRFRTPFVAAGVATLLVGVGAVLPVALGGALWPSMEVFIVVSAAGYITAYLLVCVAAPVFLHRIGESTPRAVLLSAVGAALLAIALVAYLTVEIGSKHTVSVWIFLVTMAAGAIGGIALVARRPWLSRTVGLYDEPTTADVLGGEDPG